MAFSHPAPTDPRRIAMTGAAGVVGRILRDLLPSRYQVRALTHRTTDFPSVVVDLEDVDGLTLAFADVDAVIHLAAASTVDADWASVLTANIVGTRNVFEAAVRAGVGRVVFASSNHVVGGYEINEAPDIYARSAGDHISEEAPVRPDSLYGVSKTFGEAIGRYYADHFGLSVICLRIGTVRVDDDPTSREVAETATWMSLSINERFDRMQATWLSHRDCANLFVAAIETRASWAVAYGVSDNPHRFWSLRVARASLGFEPADSASAGHQRRPWEGTR